MKFIIRDNGPPQAKLAHRTSFHGHCSVMETPYSKETPGILTIEGKGPQNKETAHIKVSSRVKGPHSNEISVW
jgi:hypothetical protein